MARIQVSQELGHIVLLVDAWPIFPHAKPRRSVKLNMLVGRKQGTQRLVKGTVPSGFLLFLSVGPEHRLHQGVEVAQVGGVIKDQGDL